MLLLKVGLKDNDKHLKWICNLQYVGQLVYSFEEPTYIERVESVASLIG
jgi:hypothetical protein